MKKVLLLAGLFIWAENSYSQVIKVNAGISITSINVKDHGNASKNLAIPTGTFGIEYLQKKWFYLSSEIGYLKIGGRYDPMMGGNFSNIDDWDFGHVNTTFRVRGFSPAKRTEFYAGAGPYMNFLLSNNNSDHSLYAALDTRKLNAGAKTEVGITRHINRLRLGINGTYLIPLSPLATSPYTSINYKAWAVLVSVGYKLH